MKLTLFKEIDFLNAVKALFHELKIPVNYVADEPTTAKEILKNTYKDNATFNLIDDVYFVGMVDDAAFEGNQSLSADKIKSDYDGVLIFGITLHQRENNLLPTRSQLAEISRAFNREFYYTPVVLVFKYRDNVAEYLAFANTERLKYKQEWREGEKAGKVSLLRDINIKKPHRGHEDIISQLKIPTSGTKQVDSFAKLYNYWQEVFSVSILSKKFYRELQNWYFWAIKEVSFPNQPKILDENIDGDEVKLQEAIKEHKAKNVIRLLTRILFIWFIKEKKLIPEEIFDEETIADKLIDDFTPQKPHGFFSTGNTITKNSKYYRAILQNLFFATLNQEMGKRTFRNDKQHQNVTNLMRYKSYFKDPDYFVQLMEDVVPFMNGGLFECLDKPHRDIKGRQGGDIIIYTDGFSDRPDNTLIVPDYLFFDVDEDVDLSADFGSTAKVYKNAKTRGLLEILKSYKFTITENTPIEEDVALDPELLGKVFENLLASYNPETKTTARKQTGSFYTPREIVNYMVDESLIAYLKNEISDWNIQEEQLDKDLHQLFSFDETNPFNEKPELQKQIIKALDKSTILDPACGSGAFPMGALQIMVHVLHKIDPDNTEWKQRQIDKVNNAIQSLEEIEDAKFREQSIKELKAQIKDIEDAFENNELDYGRKLFLIENCIYGVDIQSIATQISKLRFFISLIVDQKIDKDKSNFGIRPLPNLETKFVAANTLIGIDTEYDLSSTDKVKELKKELKKVRHRLFSAKTQKTKRNLREADKTLRDQIADELEKTGWENKTARQLASWDPYDQNASSPFFDPEWMFDIKEGFDVVIGNPPYIKEYTDRSAFDGLRNAECYQGKMDLWYLFGCKSIDLLKEKGNTTFIATNNWVTNEGASKFRNKVLQNTVIKQFLDFRDFMIFESASIQTMVYLLEKVKRERYNVDFRRISTEKSTKENADELLLKVGMNDYFNLEIIPNDILGKRISFVKSENYKILENISAKSNFILDKTKEVAQGIVAPQDFLNKKGEDKLYNTIPKGSGIFNLTNIEKDNLNLQENELELVKPFYNSNELFRYYANPENKLWVIYTGSEFNDPNSMNKYPNLKRHLDKFSEVITSDNKPYGLHRARKEYFFKGEKIISQRKCPDKPVFSYSNFDCYVSQTYFVIKTKRINQKYLTGLLNSTLIAFWLKNKGKMQGTAYQVDKGPILEIPIHKPIDDTQHLISTIVDMIIWINQKDDNLLTYDLENIIDAIVFELYFPDHMKEREIDVLQFVERDIEAVWPKHLASVQKQDAFDTLSDTEKEEVIKQLHQKWTDPDNEVVKRISSFAKKSPEILKPILEG